MDFGLVSSSVLASSDPETKQSKLYGSGSLKTERSEISCSEDDDWRSSKKAMFLYDNQQMLSFSSPKSDALPYHRNTGYNSGNLNVANMHGFIAGVRGPFTPSQWMELEHQALIYKYINANVPIPSNLLIPIKRALDSALFSTYSGIAFRPNALGWGSYHMGYSNTDPEPGRCRRTDGKKWRCARDAVVDQKYCERHINRGRHRSRKPVEGQSGHSVAGTITTAAATTKLMSNNTSSTMTHQSQAAAQLKRNYPNNDKLCERTLDTPVLSLLSSKANSFSIPKQSMSSYEESSQSGFGLVSSDCLLNPSQKSFTFMNSNSSKNQETHPLRHFMDDWPKNQTSETQLSVSIPITPSDFMSSTSSPSNHSPLRASREHTQIEMGLGMGNVSNWVPISWESSAGGPLGEVLHNTANSNKAECDNNNNNDNNNSSALNLMTEGWESNSHSPRVGSSPTGVLQKMTFGSLSNSSAGSSPRTENNRGHEGYSFFSDPLGSTLNI